MFGVQRLFNCVPNYNTRSEQLLSYALNDELCFYDMDYVPKKQTMFEQPG